MSETTLLVFEGASAGAHRFFGTTSIVKLRSTDTGSKPGSASGRPLVFLADRKR